MSLRRPLIGITLSAKYEPEEASHGMCHVNWNYPEAIVNAGGNPIGILPMTDPQIALEMMDGWLIIGGDDIDSTIYGEEKHPKSGLVDPRRYNAEATLFKQAPANLPILGICYGCQFLNVQHGGSLHQHIPDLVGHEEHAGGTLADYSIIEGTKLHSIMRKGVIRGKSYHHQAINRVGTGLVVNANHADGTIEGVESTIRPWTLGVQWHPERTLEDQETKDLFAAFVEVSRAYRDSRG